MEARLGRSLVLMSLVLLLNNDLERHPLGGLAHDENTAPRGTAGAVHRLASQHAGL
jgi:hypothetical protein